MGFLSLTSGLFDTPYDCPIEDATKPAHIGLLFPLGSSISTACGVGKKCAFV